MGFTDIFKIKEFKQNILDLNTKNDSLSKEVEKLQAMMTPEMWDALKLKEFVADLNNKSEQLSAVISSKENKCSELDKDIYDKFNVLSDIKKVEDLNDSIATKTIAISSLNSEIEKLKQQIIQLDDEILYQSFGLYEPKYDFVNSEEYKKRLQKIRQKQKDLIKSGEATNGSINWKVNGNAAQGKKMVKDMQKLLLRAFNNECDTIIEKVKYNTYETALKRMESSCEAISKLGKIMDVSIKFQYYKLKVQELDLALEYRKKKQEEKELQKELRAQMREEAKLQKEIEAERKKIEKEQTHYQNALKQLLSQLDTASDEDKAELLAKKVDIENKLSEINKSFADIDYRAANQRAGYVYIISNIGSFGENIYKIGMTRRLDPTERVDELGDASVPFNFDIHAMIFSDDAPKLESALHKAFENRKLNLVNQRREFFNVTLDEIKAEVKKNFDKTVEFIDIADAEQYRISKKLKENIKHN